MLALGSILVPGGTPVAGGDVVREATDYGRLLAYIAESDLEGPLVLIENHPEKFDRNLNRENIAYLNGNTALLQQIQDKLHSDTVKWKLARSSKRLLAVPENREAYARLFESYCKDAIAFVLDRIQQPSPFTGVTTLDGPLRDTGDGGTTAYLVHNLAEEYVEEYLFYDPENQGAQIKIKLSNKVYTGIIGAYSSQLVIGEDHQFEFVREPYTLWQNSALNPLNVLIVPVEETLHGVLRDTTEDAIMSELTQKKPQTVEDVKAVIDYWMAVEEAAVSGLVAQLMPKLLARFISKPLDEQMATALAERRSHDQYRFLDRGIRMVADMGVNAALSFYRNRTQAFAHLVSEDERAAL